MATLAPSIGPTLGGWITFSYSWKWIFFINVPVGVLAFVLTSRLVEDPPWIKADRANFFKLDRIGFALLSLSMASLEIFLDKGEEWNWFGSGWIRFFFAIFFVSFPALIWYEWKSRNPLMQVRLYTYKNFAICSALMLITGGVLSCSTVLQPQLTQSLFGYTPTLAGMTLSGGGLALLCAIPLAGRALKRFPARNMIALGFLLYTMVFLWSAWNLNFGVGFSFLTTMRIVQVIGLPFIFITLTTASYFGLPQEYNNQVSGFITPKASFPRLSWYAEWPIVVAAGQHGPGSTGLLVGHGDHDDVLVGSSVQSIQPGIGCRSSSSLSARFSASTRIATSRPLLSHQFARQLALIPIMALGLRSIRFAAGVASCRRQCRRKPRGSTTAG